VEKPPSTPEEKRKDLLKKISKNSKKGKLTKKDEDEKEEKKVPLAVYKAIFSNMGGLWLYLPFLASIQLFSYLEFYREKSFKQWANRVAKQQQAQYY
jgi:hypothetical protein